MENVANGAKTTPTSPKTNNSGSLTGIRRLSSWVNRMMMAGANFGTSFGGLRDYNAAFGWSTSITLQDIMLTYNRGGIAKRIVHAYADATWGKPPQVYTDGNEAWNQEWKDLVTNQKLWQVLYRLDVLANLGRYSLLLIGTDKGPLTSKLKGAKKITFMQPYGEISARIKSWNQDQLSPKFGMPGVYSIYPDDLQAKSTSTLVSSDTTPLRRSFEVDASRVLHVTHGAIEDQVYGLPAYAPIWNYLADLSKVVGSSSESYWMTANRGLSADVDKEMDMDPEDEAALSAEIDEYQHGLRRFIRTRGVKVSSLGSDVADPSGAFKVLITLIAGATGIPQRILLGSESGSLASSQDKGNWAERIEEYRELHAEPVIIEPLLAWLIENGLLSDPGEPVQVLWPDAYRMNPLERGQTSAQTARTMANVTKALETKPDLITREEARAMIGLSTDNQVLATDPQI